MYSRGALSRQGFHLNPSFLGYFMAPIVKEADSPVVATTTSVPTSPLSKSPMETPTRPQPVAIEIPVTVNGARTVEGSDKREPFSETTLTVLVFGHGAVVRIATPLAPGQLVFLTNEKSKKEVVCQVVKSKSGGSTGAYVELLFTEPAPGFWGIKSQGTSATPAGVLPGVSRPAPPAAPPAPRTIAPAPPAAALPAAPTPFAPVEPVPASAKTEIAAAPAAPTAAPAKPEISPLPPAPVAHEEVSTVPAVVPEPPAPPVSVAPPPVVAAPELPVVHVPAPEIPAQPAAAAFELPPAPPQPPAAVAPPPPELPKLAIPTVPLGDYSKEIETVFASPHTPASQPAAQKPEEETPGSDSATPSTQELKRHAARLQAQLGAMLFTEAPVPPTDSPALPPTSKTDPSLDEIANKVVEISHEAPSPASQPEPKPATPARKPISTSLPAAEEVKIPAWLAPLSQSPEPAPAVPPPASKVPPQFESSVQAIGDEFPVATVESSHYPEDVVIAGQLLGESSVEHKQAASTGSRKGLSIGIAATVLLAASVGAWYYRQALFGGASGAAAKSASVSASSPRMPVSAASPANSASTPALNPGSSASNNVTPTSSQTTKNASPVATPAPTTTSAASKNSNPAPENSAPAEPASRPSLGDVRLASPVVNRADTSSESGEPAPAIETSAPSSGAEELAAATSATRKEPTAPVPVGGDVTPAQLLKSVPPAYPAMARSQRISGNVQIDALIDESGSVSAVKVLSGPPLLHRAALDAVKQWKYSPALLDGKPTSMHLTVTVQFRAQ